MLAGLGHRPIVSRDNQQDVVDGCCTGQHVAHQPLMSWYINESDGGAIRNGQVSKPEVDRDAALFLFFQTVRVNTCERFYQRSFAMVNVAGRSNNHEISFWLLPSSKRLGKTRGRNG